MATATQFEPNVDQFGAPIEPKSKMSGCLKGCLIVAVVLVVLAVIFAAFVYFKGRSLAAGAAAAVINEGIDQSSLSPQEKAEVKAEVERAVQAFRDGKMTWEQLGRLMQELGNSPLMAVMLVSVGDQHLNNSGLSDDEKTAGRQSIRRFKRGLFDKKIPATSVDSLLAHVADKDQRGQWKMRQQVSDQDMRAFLDEAKAEADKAQVAAEPEDIDVSAEIKRAIDAALGGQ